jgi:hypothetical protein
MTEDSKQPDADHTHVTASQPCEAMDKRIGQCTQLHLLQLFDSAWLVCTTWQLAGQLAGQLVPALPTDAAGIAHCQVLIVASCMAGWAVTYWHDVPESCRCFSSAFICGSRIEKVRRLDCVQHLQ